MFLKRIGLLLGLVSSVSVFSSSYICDQSGENATNETITIKSTNSYRNYDVYFSEQEEKEGTTWSTVVKDGLRWERFESNEVHDTENQFPLYEILIQRNWSNKKVDNVYGTIYYGGSGLQSDITCIYHSN